ncbi:ABC transporter substrate-binding protein [Frankia sp. CIT1]|uniref:ABC transporter substrate-binding protein n=3 Tax=unclassified Frankia TaxID=2632575 RepID=UPI001EF5C3C9|nr:ABC transporter substrate-binding protein [Frankia sp. CIT1]
MSWLYAPSRSRGAALAAMVGVLAITVLAAGCATKKNADTNGAPGAAGGVAIGPGVTDKVIKLGVLTDRTGPFAGAGIAAEQGRLLYWDKKNAAGGICGRQVQFVVKDHGYNPQKAVTAYSQMEGEVLALDELLGSPEIAALLPSLQSNQMLTMAASWSSALLSNPYVVISGTTYDIEMINGIEWLLQQKRLATGDKIGHIFVEGDYGENAVAGSRAAAKALGLQLVEQKVKATDTDLTGQITALRSADVKAVLLTTTPPQTASAVGVAEAAKFTPAFLASNPAFSPQLLNTAAGAALEKRLLVATSTAPFSSTAPGPSQVRSAFEAKYAGQPKSSYVMYGYAQGEIMARILDTACRANTLTRPGLLTAFQSLANVQTDGLVAPLDYSKSGRTPARQIYLARPDSAAAGGLTQIQDLFATPLASSYQPTG